MCPPRETLPQASASNPAAYKLSLGHMEDLTLNSFAYLRLPLALAAVAFLIGAVGTLLRASQARLPGDCGVMVVFFHAARLAMVTFDPYLSSKPLVEPSWRARRGDSSSITTTTGYSSISFYTERTELLLNGSVLQ